MANKKIIITADSKKPKMELSVNTTKFEKSLGKAEKQLKDFTNSPFEAVLRVEDNATAVVKRVTRLAGDFANSTYKATLAVDTSKVTSGINLIKRQLDTLTVGGWNLKLNVTPSVAPGIAGNSSQPQYGSTATYATPNNAGSLERTVYGFAALGSIISDYRALFQSIGDINKSIGKIGRKATALSGLSRIGNVLKYFGAIEGVGMGIQGAVADNSYDRTNNFVKGGTLVATSLGGAKLGATIGTIFGPAGTAIGAGLGGGLGYLVGKLGGDSIANLFTGGKIGAQKDAAVSPDAAKRLEELRAKQAELAKSTLDDKFGQIKLSAQQMAVVAEGLFSHAQTARIYGAEVAISNLNDSMLTLQESSGKFDSELAMATATGSLSAEQSQSLGYSASSFTEGANNTLNQQGYAGGKSVDAIMEDSKEGKELKENIEKGFSSKDDKLQQLIGSFEQTMSNAQADGKISGQEQKEISDIQGKINALLTNQSNDSSLEANLAKFDFGKGTIDWNSFTGVIGQAAIGADQRAAALDQDYQAAAQYLSPEERSTLLMGGNGKGDKQGLYHQQTQLYTGTVDKAAEQFQKQMGGEVAYFMKPVAELQEDKTYQEYIAQKGNLDKGEKASIGEFVDSMAPLIKSLVEVAQKYETAGQKVPEELQEQLKWFGHLNAVSDGGGLNWLAEENRGRKFKSSDYADIAQQASVPETQQQLSDSNVQMLSDGKGAVTTFPINCQLMINGKPVIDKGAMLTQEDFGISRIMQAEVDIYIKENKLSGEAPETKPEVLKSKPPVDITKSDSWFSQVFPRYRGGIVGSNGPEGFANGGYVQGGSQLITVAEEGTPEAIIPLGSHRRKRALELFSQVGRYLGAEGFATGGIIGGAIGGSISTASSATPTIDVGGVEIKIEAKDGQNLVEAIKENKQAISEEIAGVFNAAFRGQFANTPATGGAS